MYKAIYSKKVNVFVEDSHEKKVYCIDTYYIFTGCNVRYTYPYQFSQCCSVHWKIEFVHLIPIVS